MKIEETQVINAPDVFVFARIVDANELSERLPSKVSLRNPQQLDEFIKGSLWVAKIQRGGRMFTVNNVISRNESPSKLWVDSESNRLTINTKITLEALSENQTQMQLMMDIQPKGLLGRILLQTLRSSRSRIHNNLGEGLQRMASHLEKSYSEEFGHEA